MKIICIIPSYKEKGNLEELSIRLSRVLNSINVKHQILFVIQTDDGSLTLLKQLKRKIPEVDYLFFSKPLGIGVAYKKGFEKVADKFSHILTLDGDLNHNPSDIPNFMKAMKSNNADIIIGSRYVKGGKFNDNRLWKRIISLSTNNLLTRSLRINIHDISSGFRLIKREVIEKILPDLSEKGYPSYMELILIARKNNFKIFEIPITYSPRKWGNSKMKKIRTFIDYILFFTKCCLFTKYPNQ